jgi:hypothetical protein
LSHLPISAVSRELYLANPAVSRLTQLQIPRNMMEKMANSTAVYKGNMSRVRNILISFGVYWLTRWGSVWLDWLFSKLTDRIVYGDGVLYAIAMGIMISMGRTVAAMLAGMLVTLTVVDRKPERWAVMVAALYVFGPGLRTRWHLPPTVLDRLWQSVNLLFPAIACIAAAAITVRLRRRTATKLENVADEATVPR